MDELFRSGFFVEALAVVGVLILAFAVTAWLLVRSRGAAEKFPYGPIPVLSEAEKQFYNVLRESAPAGTIVLMKVRLADFLEVTERTEDFLRYFGRISQKHADFLLVDEASSEPLVVIELDDSTHRHKAKTVENDRVKNKIYEAARLPILRWKAAGKYSARELSARIREMIPESNA